jgi:hypothetical protein
MERRRVKRRPLATVLLLALLDSATAIPYTPSSLFLSSKHNDSLAYLLRPSSDTGKTQFLSLNVSDVNTSSPSLNTLLEQTPFHSTEQNSTFIPAIDDRGILTVYTGDCHSAGQRSLWRFKPDNSSSIGNGTWDQLSISPDDKKTQPNYLAAGFAFATSNNSDTSIYSFGGMCPFSNSTDETWVSAANYSQTMATLAPKSKGSKEYEAAITGDRAPPVPEAGMAVVPLAPPFSPTDVQRDFLFIGGHTQQAFLNMSQLAIFSVPQESWSFVDVNTESKLRTELAIRDAYTVEPRSGHAAVLSEDGKKVYVIGGWVGDTSTPAEPQFAVLELGAGYGGSDTWTWTIPSSTTTSEELGIADGAGIFGHSAALLPGDVLMIAGGYSIPKQSSKRATSSQHNSQIYLYNVTSSSWVKSYSNPSTSQSTLSASSKSHSGGLSSGQKAGLGVGLGIGIPIILLIVFCAWKYDRKRRVRGHRDSQLRELALGAERAHFWGRDDPNQASSMRSSQMSERHDSGVAYSWSGNESLRSKPSWKPRDQSNATAEQTGLLMDSSPTRNTRPVGQPRSYSNNRMSGWERRRSEAASDIHPIDEREEDEAIFRERLMSTIPAQERPKIHDPDDPFSDTPFATPRSTIFGVGLGPFYTRRKDGGSVDDASKSDRTSTNLSDSSNFSFSSANPTGQVNQAKGVVVDRPLSWASSGGHSITATSTHSRETTNSDVDPMTAPSEKSYSADSYSTAQSTFSHRQAENESLLNETIDTPITPVESSPSKLAPAFKPRTSDWMLQTVRRALTITRRGTTSLEEDESAPLASGVDRRSTVIVSNLQSGGASGTSTPRRAVSASAELFRRKQGARDWNAKKRMSDGHFAGPRSTRDDLYIGAPGYLGNDDTCDEDWDLEGAVDDRNVQMTYTVPREKLRVVNGNASDNISERSVSRGASAGTRIVSR